jgi:hypothetical protein
MTAESTGGKFENTGGNTVEGRPFSADDIKRLPVEVFDKYYLEKTMGPKVEESNNDDVVVKKDNQEDKGSIGTKIAAGLAAGILGATGVGIAAPSHASAEENGANFNPKSAVYEEGKVTSQNAVDEYLATAGVKLSAEAGDLTPAPLAPPAPEVTPSILDLLVTDDAKYEEYVKKAQEMFFDFDSPLSIEMVNNCVEAWKIRTFEGYKNEFRKEGQNDEYWLKIGSEGLLAFDNAWMMGPLGNFVNYVSREEFFNEVVTGNTENYLCDDEDHPLSRLVHYSNRMRENFEAGNKTLIAAGVDNLYDAWHDSGACIFLADDIDPNNDLISLVNQWGVIGFDWTENNTKDLKDKGLINQSIRNLDELISVSFSQKTMALGLNSLEGISGPAWIGYREIVKSKTYGEMLNGLNDDLLKKIGLALINQAKSKADEYSKYGISMDSDLTKRLIELALTGEIPGKKFLVNGK